MFYPREEIQRWLSDLFRLEELYFFSGDEGFCAHYAEIRSSVAELTDVAESEEELEERSLLRRYLDQMESFAAANGIELPNSGSAAAFDELCENPAEWLAVIGRPAAQ